MRKLLLAAILSSGILSAQQLRWGATTGDVSQSGSASSSTIQQPATNATTVYLDQVVVYCSVACAVSFAANGTAATTTAGTVIPIVPNPLAASIPFNFFTASNVGAGTGQGGITHIPAGGTVTFCFSQTCGASGQVSLINTGVATTNFTVTVGAITGTSNTLWLGRTQ